MYGRYFTYMYHFLPKILSPKITLFSVTCSTCQVVSHAEPQPELHLTLPSGFRTIQEGLNDYFSVSQGPQYNCERYILLQIYGRFIIIIFKLLKYLEDFP